MLYNQETVLNVFGGTAKERKSIFSALAEKLPLTVKYISWSASLKSSDILYELKTIPWERCVIVLTCSYPLSSNHSDEIAVLSESLSLNHLPHVTLILSTDEAIPQYRNSVFIAPSTNSERIKCLDFLFESHGISMTEELKKQLYSATINLSCFNLTDMFLFSLKTPLLTFREIILNTQKHSMEILLEAAAPGNGEFHHKHYVKDNTGIFGLKDRQKHLFNETWSRLDQMAKRCYEIQNANYFAIISLQSVLVKSNYQLVIYILK
jgi:hypothetical protein